MPYTKQRNPTGNTSEYRDRSRMYDLPAKADKIGIIERKREGGREKTEARLSKQKTLFLAGEKKPYPSYHRMNRTRYNAVKLQ